MTPHAGSARVAEKHCPLTNFFCARLSLHKKCVLGPSGPRVNFAAGREIGVSILYDRVPRERRQISLREHLPIEQVVNLTKFD